MSLPAAGQRVIHRPRPELGFGRVRLVEEDAFGESRCQVEFEHHDGYLAVPPAELEIVPWPWEEFAAGELGDIEVFQRKLLAGVVVGENNRTGAFLRAAAQPLPHQAFLLDKILSGNRFGHVLADDVGLGKTVEAGLIIMSLLQQEAEARVLVMCPAGLALQWQDEMDEHFQLVFGILGRDFNPRTAAGWRGRQLIIAPIDTAKREEHASTLHAVGPFHVVICDEAHRLSARREFLSGELRTTANYRLFRDLVERRTIEFVTGGDGAPRSPRLLLLSATPHQGDDVRFGYLLKLVRPDLFGRIDEEVTTDLTPENLRESITRTAKSRATDWQGRPLFKGHVTETQEVDWTNDEREMAQELTRYIRQSLLVAENAGRARALVIELVMHTFHKIAASSWRALEEALDRRQAALLGGAVAPWSDDDPEADEGETANSLAQPEWFAGERLMIGSLLDRVRGLQVDSKWAACAELLSAIEAAEPGAKVLFFTQYRATQSALLDHLSQMFPGAGVTEIHGGLSLEERRDARRSFEGPTRFLVSTEAGGEGVNLHRACHVMINYDLPWNPMRLQQRIGRLDRYGQRVVVQVFNLRVPESWDARISTRIDERLATVQATMGPIAGGLEDYREMILGNVASQIDAPRIFADWRRGRHAPVSDTQIDDWVRDAVASARRWEQLFSRDLGLNGLPAQPQVEGTVFRSAYDACLSAHGLRLSETRTSEQQLIPGVFHFPLPAEFRGRELRASREVYVVFDKDRFGEVRGEVLGRARGQEIKPALVGFGEPITDWLFQGAFVPRRVESAFSICAGEGWQHGEGWLFVATLRWLGAARRLRAPDSLAACFIADAGASRLLSASELATLAKGASPSSTAAAENPPSQETARPLVQAHLRALAEPRGPHARANAGWNWLLLARVAADVDSNRGAGPVSSNKI